MILWRFFQQHGAALPSLSAEAPRPIYNVNDPTKVLAGQKIMWTISQGHSICRTSPGQLVGDWHPPTICATVLRKIQVCETVFGTPISTSTSSPTICNSNVQL